MDEEEEGLEVFGEVEYIPKHELEPYGWHDILATFDVCGNIHENARYCYKEGYNIMSTYMVSIIQEREESVIESSGYDKEINL